jgi:hypothetical protein
MITVDVLLNCNHSLFKNYRKKFIRDGNTKEAHNSNGMKLRIYVYTCINIQKGFLFYIRIEATLNRYKVYLFIQKLSQLKVVRLSTISILNIEYNLKGKT